MSTRRHEKFLDAEAYCKRIENRGGKVRGIRFPGPWYDVAEESLRFAEGGKSRERLSTFLPSDTEPEGTELEKLLYPPVNDCESQRT